MKITNRFLPRATLLAIFAASVSFAAQSPAQNNKKIPPPQNKKPTGPPGAFISKDGLRPDSPQIFSLYRGNVCVKKGRFGSPAQVAPGTYDLRVGYPSGWVTREIQVQSGKRQVIPTGLLRFENLTPPGLKSTVPQRLYQGDHYLATGYQGMTARLFPGAYTVRYHAASDQAKAKAFRKWDVAGPFFLGQMKNNNPLTNSFPPEQKPAAPLAASYPLGKATIKSRKLDGAMEITLRDPKISGVYYLSTRFDSPQAGETQFVFNSRGGVQVWLNGKQIKNAPPDQRRLPKRVELFAPLKKGQNTLLVKTFFPKYSTWTFSAQMERWRSYQITVGENAPPQTKGLDRAALTRTAAAPLKGIEGIVFCQVPNLRGGISGLHPEQFRIVRRPVKSSICTLIPAAPDGKLTDLTSKHFVAAIQPDLSYDGKKILFAARKDIKTDPWTIYEMNLDGSGLRQITRDLDNCLDPYYLPNGRIIFSSDKTGFRDEYDRDKASLLYSCEPDGSDADRLTFNLSSDLAPIVLQDGRVLFTSWQHHGEHQSVAGTFALFTIMPDGTQFTPFSGNHYGVSRTKSYAQQLTDGRVVFVETAGHRHYNGGGLSTVEMRNPHATRRVLTPGMIYDGNNMAGRYASPYPLPGGAMLCSYSPGRGTSPLDPYPSEEIHMGIYTFDFKSGRPARLIYDDPGCQDYDALAIYKRPVPTNIPRMYVPGKKTGTMLCVNAYLNDRPKFNGRILIGELPPAEPGEIKGVRVVEGFGVQDTDPSKHRSTVIDILQMSFGSNSNGGNAFEQKRIVGYAPVEKDGSFHIEVPADTALSLQTLDKNDMAIETQLTWAWTRPGESRLCVGCHEDRASALPNIDCEAMKKKAHFVAPPEEERYTVDFRRDIMPIIEKKCSGCHNEKKKSGGLDLRKGFDLVFHRAGIRGRALNAAFFNQAYESLLEGNAQRVGRLVVSGAARHSPLIWRLYGKQLGLVDNRNPYKKPIKLMPPRKPLSDAEKKLFVEWIDIGAQWDNIPAEDNLPGYDAAQSKIMAAEAKKEVAKTILDPEKAFKTRCLECHDTTKLVGMKNKNEAQLDIMMKRMVAKRKGWIHPEEIPLIMGHIKKTIKP